MTNSSDPVQLFTIDDLCGMEAVFDLIRQGNPFHSADWTVHQFVIAFGIRASLRKPDDAPVLYWRSFLSEFKIFLCTKNRKYASLRRRLVLTGNESQTALVSVIAASIGARVGAIGAVIAPLVILSLIVVMRVGIEAFCRMQEQEIHTYRPFGDEQ